MARLESLPPPHCRESPPWTECGARGPDSGRLFAREVAGGALALSFDRAGRQHAVTYFHAHDVGPQVVIYERRFDVLRVGGA